MGHRRYNSKASGEKEQNRQTVFEPTPSDTRCCLCRHNLKRETVEELRPTGIAGKAQRWHFCPDCYIDYNEVCNCPVDGEGLTALARLCVLC